MQCPINFPRQVYDAPQLVRYVLDHMLIECQICQTNHTTNSIAASMFTDNLDDMDEQSMPYAVGASLNDVWAVLGEHRSTPNSSSLVLFCHLLCHRYYRFISSRSFDDAAAHPNDWDWEPVPRMSIHNYDLHELSALERAQRCSK